MNNDIDDGEAFVFIPLLLLYFIGGGIPFYYEVVSPVLSIMPEQAVVSKILACIGLFFCFLVIIPLLIRFVFWMIVMVLEGYDDGVGGYMTISTMGTIGLILVIMRWFM